MATRWWNRPRPPGGKELERLPAEAGPRRPAPASGTWCACWAPEDRPGRWVIPRGRAETVLWRERVLRAAASTSRTRPSRPDIVISPAALALLSTDDQRQLILQVAELRRRAAGPEELRTVVEDLDALERDLQSALEGQHRIFGGRFGGEAAHRRLAPGDESTSRWSAVTAPRTSFDGTGRGPAPHPRRVRHRAPPGQCARARRSPRPPSGRAGGGDHRGPAHVQHP